MWLVLDTNTLPPWHPWMDRLAYNRYLDKSADLKWLLQDNVISYKLGEVLVKNAWKSLRKGK